MAVIDTLKLARALRDDAGFSAQSAEATAAALGSALGDEVATKADLDRVGTALRAEIAEVKADLRLLRWHIAIVWALQIAILVKLFVH